MKIAKTESILYNQDYRNKCNFKILSEYRNNESILQEMIVLLNDLLHIVILM
ncbi:20861_t:CDS:1, partial [Cetraspora pellucida]